MRQVAGGGNHAEEDQDVEAMDLEFEALMNLGPDPLPKAAALACRLYPGVPRMAQLGPPNAKSNSSVLAVQDYKLQDGAVSTSCSNCAGAGDS